MLLFLRLCLSFLVRLLYSRRELLLEKSRPATAAHGAQVAKSKTQAERSRQTVPGPRSPAVERLEANSDYGKAGDRGALASSRLSLVLELAFPS
jgi:hypothetical protein